MESLLYRLIFIIFAGRTRREAPLAGLRSGCSASGAGVLNSYKLLIIFRRKPLYRRPFFHDIYPLRQFHQIPVIIRICKEYIYLTISIK